MEVATLTKTGTARGTRIADVRDMVIENASGTETGRGNETATKTGKLEGVAEEVVTRRIVTATLGRTASPLLAEINLLLLWHLLMSVVYQVGRITQDDVIHLKVMGTTPLGRGGVRLMMR